MNLFQINTTIRELIDSFDGEAVNDEDLGKLDALQLAADAKARAIIGIIKEQRALADAIRQQERSLAELRKARDNKADALERYLASSMEINGVDRLTFDIGEAKFAKCPPSVELDDAETVPDEFVRHKIEADKSKILDHWRSTGECVVGAKIVTDKRSLRIK